MALLPPLQPRQIDTLVLLSRGQAIVVTDRNRGAMVRLLGSLRHRGLVEWSASVEPRLTAAGEVLASGLKVCRELGGLV